MTKKDYELIAAAIKDNREYDPMECYAEALDDVARSLATALQRDNPRFDRDRFLKACGVDAENILHNLAQDRENMLRWQEKSK